MRLLNVIGLKFKQSVLVIISLFTVFLLWKWEKGSLYNTKLLQPESLALSHPANLQFVDRNTSMEEDFSITDPLARSVPKVGKEVTDAPAPLSIIPNAKDVADQMETSPPEKKANSQFVDQNTSLEEDFSSVDPLAWSVAEVGKEVTAAPPPLSIVHNAEEVTDKKEAAPPEKKECDYRNGKWVPDDRRPLYSGLRCKRWLSEDWDCRLTQRTDFAYEKFRWQPEGCEMPMFQAAQFLRRMQDKTIAYVGDSLGRQMFQSMMCMVGSGKDRSAVEDVGSQYGFILKRRAKRPDGWAYRFRSTNTTILYYWSSTLSDLKPLRASNPSAGYAMHLDRPPSFLRKNLHRFHVLVLNTGHHWNRGKLKANRWEMYVSGAPNSNPNIAFIWKAKNFTIHSVVKWLDAKLPRNPHLKVFYRSLSPRHFFNGEWNTGGTCDNTDPLAKGNAVFLNHSEDANAEGAVKGTRIKLLDITALSRLRDEGHISRYSIGTTQGVQDCLHWCLPGVPDTWNEILAAQL